MKHLRGFGKTIVGLKKDGDMKPFHVRKSFYIDWRYIVIMLALGFGVTTGVMFARLTRSHPVESVILSIIPMTGVRVLMSVRIVLSTEYITGATSLIRFSITSQTVK